MKNAPQAGRLTGALHPSRDKERYYSPMPLDVIIVGGGIGGAVLANLLGRSRKSCIVLEREAHPLAIVRPEILWPATVATLSGLLPARELHGSALLPLHGLAATTVALAVLWVLATLHVHRTRAR